MKDHFHTLPVQKELVRGQNYPIKWNRDRDDGNLFLDGCAEGSVLEFPHHRRILGDDAALWKDDKTLSLIQGLQRFHERDVAAFKLCAIDGNMQLAVHEPKHGNVFEIILSHEHSVVLVEAKGDDVHVRAMIGAKDVLPLAIESGPVLNGEWYADEDQQQPGPPSVEFSHESELLWKNDWDQQQEKEDDEK